MPKYIFISTKISFFCTSWFRSDFQLTRFRVFWAKILRLYSCCIWRSQRKGKTLQAAIFYGPQKSPKNHTVTKMVEKQMVINYLSFSKYHVSWQWQCACSTWFLHTSLKVARIISSVHLIKFIMKKKRRIREPHFHYFSITLHFVIKISRHRLTESNISSQVN